MRLRGFPFWNPHHRMGTPRRGVVAEYAACAAETKFPRKRKDNHEMTFADLQKVEQLVGEFCHDYSVPGLPAALSTTYARVDVDLTYCCLRADLVRDWLAERTRRLGYLYDFWFPDKEPHHTLCASERGVEE